tara:strand:+ start:403 stop:708 length:306 start_codon:yes stop_codon:yes gene_type:complete
MGASAPRKHKTMNAEYTKQTQDNYLIFKQLFLVAQNELSKMNYRDLHRDWRELGFNFFLRDDFYTASLEQIEYLKIDLEHYGIPRSKLDDISNSRSNWITK